MLHIPNQQNLLSPLHYTELSIPKIPVREWQQQLLLFYVFIY